MEALTTHPLARELIATKAIQRLKGISFLGGIAAVPAIMTGDDETPRSRFDHSLSVAELAFQALDMLDLDQSNTDELIASALLHDVGHMPFSHSSERFYKIHASLDHQSLGELILQGNIAEFVELNILLKDFGINVSNVIRNIFYRDGALSYFFKSPVNLDTLDGIFYCASLVTGENYDIRKNAVLRQLCHPSHENVAASDFFWALKNTIYASFLSTNAAQRYDEIVCEFLFDRGVDVAAHLYLETDRCFYDDNELNFSSFVRKSLDSQEKPNCCIASMKRRFLIDRDVVILGRDSLEQRYEVVNEPGDLGGL